MNQFAEALISQEKSNLIPDEYDYWKDLIGSWSLDYVEGYGTPNEKHVQGEWHFARILEGLGIQDIFICPARPERTDTRQGEYGATIRMYNPAKKQWDMVYTCLENMSRFVGTKENGRVVLTNITTTYLGLIERNLKNPTAKVVEIIPYFHQEDKKDELSDQSSCAGGCCKMC